MRTHGTRGARKSRKALSQPLARLIHLDSGIWSWDFRNCYILMRSPDNETTHTVTQPKMTGWSWDALERAQYKRTGNRPAPDGVQITPAVVRDWIQEHYL